MSALTASSTAIRACSSNSCSEPSGDRPADTTTSRSATLSGQGVLEQGDGPLVAGGDHQAGVDPPVQPDDLLGRVRGVALPRLLGPLLVPPLRPPARVGLVERVVVAPGRAVQVRSLPPVGDEVGPFPVGQDGDVGGRLLAPPDDLRAEDGSGAQRTRSRSGGRLPCSTCSAPAGRGDHGQAVARQVGIGHQRVHGGQHPFGRALGAGVVADGPPPLLRALGGVVDLRLGGEGEAQEGPWRLDQLDQVGSVGGDLRRDSGSFHGPFLPRYGSGHALGGLGGYGSSPLHSRSSRSHSSLRDSTVSFQCSAASWDSYGPIRSSGGQVPSAPSARPCFRHQYQEPVMP